MHLRNDMHVSVKQLMTCTKLKFTLRRSDCAFFKGDRGTIPAKMEIAAG